VRHKEVRDIVCSTINSNHKILTALTSYFALFEIGLIHPPPPPVSINTGGGYALICCLKESKKGGALIRIMGSNNIN
jgi:hypothetical protein